MLRIILTVTAAIAVGSVIGLALRATTTGPAPRHSTVPSAILTSTSPKEEPAPASKEASDDASPDKAEIHFDGERVIIRFGKFKVDF